MQAIQRLRCGSLREQRDGLIASEQTPPSIHPILLAALALVAAFILPACAKRERTASDAPADVLRISQRNEPADLDPATASLPDEFFVIRALGEGLLVPSADGGSPAPALAERHDVSADGLVYTFHLRAGLRWSNGEPLTAADLVASFQRTLTPATAAPKAYLFFAVKNARAFATGELADFTQVGFAAPDARTVVITLAQPTPHFLRYVASGAWIPINPRAAAQHGRTWTDPAHHVGNGPFVLTEWRSQQHIAVKKNPHYRNAAHVRLAEIQFIRFDNGDAEERAFRAGQIDVTMAVPTAKLAAYARERPAGLHRAPLAETRFLSFNTRRPPLDDPRVRRALAQAIDRQAIVDRVLLGGQEPAQRFLGPALRGNTVVPLASEFRHQPEEARQLLTAAGFSEGKKFPRLELTAWSPSQLPVLEAIQAMWRQSLGIEVALSIQEAKVHLSALASGAYDIAFVTTILDVADPVAVLRDFTRDAPDNFPHWQSDEFDRLVADAALQPNPAAQAPLLARAETLLLDAAPVAPVYFNTQNWLMAPRVQGWQQDALWNRSYDNITLDEH